MGLKSIPSIVLYAGSYIFTSVENIFRFRYVEIRFFIFFFFFRNRIWWFQILRYLKKIRKKFREHLRTRFLLRIRCIKMYRCFISIRVEYQRSSFTNLFILSSR